MTLRLRAARAAMFTLAAAGAGLVGLGLASPAEAVLTPLGSYSANAFDEGAAEIAAYDAATQRLFVTNADSNTIDILDISNPAAPFKVGTIDPSANGFAGGPNSVAVNNGIVAIAQEAATKTDPGSVLFYDTSGAFQDSVTVGALPDMLTFTPDGTRILVANEGEAEESDPPSVNPEGTISIIDISGGVASASVTTADFTDFEPGGSKALGATLQEIAEASPIDSVRIHPNAPSVAADLEPEYITVSEDGTTAFVALQENNAVAVLDIASGTITELQPLGAKDHSLPGNGLDARDNDDTPLIENQPVFGLYMPDSITSYTVNGTTYYLTANEGDSRDPDDYGDFPGGYGDETSVEDVLLDPAAFPNAATLQDDDLGIGDLGISAIDGDTDGDGDFDQLFAFGARSYSIYDEDGNLVYDSGDDFEQITSMLLPDVFNSDNDDDGSLDNRSDNKGPEPEGITVGRIAGRTYAFIGLERIGGIMTYDVTNPLAPFFVDYINTRNFGIDPEDDLLAAGDIAPEGLLFIRAADSPNGQNLLVVTNEVSGTTRIFAVTPPAVPEPATAGLVAIAGAALLLRRRRR